MAARRGESEGINLISSTYSDDDDGMEDMQHQQELPIDDDANDTKTTTTTTPNDDDDTKSNRSNDTPPISNGTVSRPLTPQQLSLSSPPQPPQAVLVAEASRSRMVRLTIVDYGHDEAALSPEAEANHYHCNLNPQLLLQRGKDVIHLLRLQRTHSPARTVSKCSTQ